MTNFTVLVKITIQLKPCGYLISEPLKLPHYNVFQSHLLKLYPQFNTVFYLDELLNSHRHEIQPDSQVPGPVQNERFEFMSASYRQQ